MAMIRRHRRRHRATLQLNRRQNARGCRIPALEQVDRIRFYVLMAELLNQLMVHHNVLSGSGKEAEMLR